MKIHPGLLAIKDFTYDLPDEKIAKYPLPERDASRLLVYRDGAISEKKFFQLSEELSEHSLLIFNNTRVVRARLLLQRISGATVEIFCTDAADSAMDFTRLLGIKKEVLVRAFVGNGKRWKEDEALQLKIKTKENPILLNAVRAGTVNDQSIIKLSWEPAELSFAEIIEAAGKIPLPPYMDREEEAVDEERYQTVYAKHKGSVAAPTAGLHFTEKVLQSLEAKKITAANVTLHVGAGTFKPVKAGEMSGHEMHREQISVSKELIEKILAQKNAPVVAVGTTALRTIVSLNWFGKQISTQPGRHFENLFVGQWEPYENTPDVPAPVALRAILDWMRENGHEELRGYTQVLIAPGYEFKIVNGLITNFHQPQSTLLLLVAAFIGDDYKRVYRYALENEFRFLSYGDSSLLWRK
jgi:S-adenosylmethionine:tRNA ribosyltransferase-isomerase